MESLRKYETLKKRLLKKSPTLRENINLYGGPIIGALIPILIARFSMWNQIELDNLGLETLKWIASTVVSAVGIPITAMYPGVALSAISSYQLVQSERRRLEREIFGQRNKVLEQDLSSLTYMRY